MVRIDSEAQRGVAGADAFGPLAVLLVGFLPEDLSSFKQLMSDMEADMIKAGCRGRAYLRQVAKVGIVKAGGMGRHG